MALLSPKLDVVFKKLFSAPGNKPLLTDFLASVLDVEPEKIQDLKIENGEITPQTLNEKFIRLDLNLSVDGKKIDIEMQCLKSEAYADRALFYWAKLFTKDLERGKPYDSLEQTISINICNFNMFDCEDFHSTFRLYEDHRHELLTDKCRIDFLELKKARATALDSQQLKRLERWMRFFNLKNEEDADMVASIDSVMFQAVTALRNYSSDDEMQMIAQMREDALREEASLMKQSWDEGNKDGIKKGMEKGIKKGMEKERDEMIAAMRKYGASEDFIQKVLKERL